MQAAPIALLQYRHKEAEPVLRYEQAHALQALCRRYRVPFIINDHVDLCADLDADGIHLGGTDAEVARAHETGPAKIIGASCYGDMTRALAAQEAGASYVAFGGFTLARQAMRGDHSAHHPRPGRTKLSACRSW
jgi:thiamine-phosphate pyrophosphorylase